MRTVPNDVGNSPWEAKITMRGQRAGVPLKGRPEKVPTSNQDWPYSDSVKGLDEHHCEQQGRVSRPPLD